MSFTTTHRVLALAAAALLGAGCRSQVDVHTVQSTQAPAISTPSVPQPKDEPNQVTVVGPKTFFQTRDPITIQLSNQLLSNASTFTVLNTTNDGGDDTKAVPVINEAVPSLGLADDKTFRLDQVSNGNLQLTFYPGENAWQGKFVYGQNTLKVVATSNTAIDYSTVTFTLQDFPVFDIAMTSFPDGNEVDTDPSSGVQFEGWVNVLSPPVVAEAGGSQLVNGMYSMINPY